VADAGGVVAFFGAIGTLAAFDPGGKALWKAELGVYPTTQGYGTGASPALHEGKVFVQCYTDEKAFVACFDKTSGKELWRVNLEKPATSWATPLVWRNARRVELVTSCVKLITSLDPASGKELWHLSGVVGPNMCSFPADRDQIYIGQASPSGIPPLYALAAGGEGDLSPASGSLDVKSQVWVQRNASPRMTTPVAADGLLYIPTENLLTCRETGTGEELYKERVPDLVAIMASPLVIGDKLLLLDEEGGAAFVRVGPEFEVVGRGKLDDLFWSTPSVAGDSLLLRGAKSLYCVRK
jgi:outer membrane protein assembly factor BamB